MKAEESMWVLKKKQDNNKGFGRVSFDSLIQCVSNDFQNLKMGLNKSVMANRLPTNQAQLKMPL